MTSLADPLRLGLLTARNRIVFGPHETNLGRRRAISERHVAYYRARAAGGAGLVVTEEASVDGSDWPYERAPLAAECEAGWGEVAAACHAEGALVIAAIGHSGGQGSSAYHQQALLGPSSVPDVVTREIPKAMEAADVEAIVGAFARAAASAVAAGADGVEVSAGQWSLLRQFVSSLTNRRDDRYGADHLLLVEETLASVRAAIPGAVVGLRASCDELAPWAGIVPETAAKHLVRLASYPRGPLFDYVTVVRGSGYATWATRPDAHTPAAFNAELAASIRGALPASVAVVCQGSLVEIDEAEALLSAGKADAVEMTRAQIADPELASKIVSGRRDRVRPCVLCNQLCQVRDVRNPIVACIGEPRSGHETTDPDPLALAAPPAPSVRSAPAAKAVIVVGAGPAGLECARVLAHQAREVVLFEREDSLGGMVTRAAARVPGRERLASLVGWLENECRLAGVTIVSGHELTLEELDMHDGPVVCCTGSRPGRRQYEVVAPGAAVMAADLLAAERLPGAGGPGPAVVWDPAGGPVGVGVAELLAALGDRVVLATPDFVAGAELARSGDLVPANTRLARAGVEVARHSVVRGVDGSGVTVEDRFSGSRQVIAGAVLVDAGYRLPEDSLARALAASLPPGSVQLAGDVVAPRTIHEAILEGRRAALRLAGAR